jgi:signal-transduction protein with cAMP-binding, CBS, and nucleotidyltransferase domain
MAIMLEPGSWNRLVRDVMKTNVVCYEEETPVKVIYEFLCRVTLRRVVIVKEGYPTGLVSRGTLLRWFSNWLSIHGHLPADLNREQAALDYANRRALLTANVRSLAKSASDLERSVEEAEDDVLPVLIDAASRMQEQINDLLADSRHFLQSSQARFDAFAHEAENALA